MIDGRFVTSVGDEISENGKYLVAKAKPEVIFARLLNELLANLSKSYIEPFTISNYIQNKEIFGFRKQDGMTIRTPMKPNNKTQAFITLEESLFIDYFTFIVNDLRSLTE